MVHRGIAHRSNNSLCGPFTRCIFIWHQRLRNWQSCPTQDLSRRYMCARPMRRLLLKALDVRIRKVRKGDIDRIIDIERSWHHLSHWSVDSYYRLLNDDSFTSSFVAEIDDDVRSRIVG